jgi:hypothetical protein
MTPRIRVTIVAEILKARFPNMNALELIELAFKIVEALDNNESA